MSCLIQSAGLEVANANRQQNVLCNEIVCSTSFILLDVCVCLCTVLDLPMHLSESAQIINRITAASDRRRFYFNEGDLSAATVCASPPSVSFNLVIRMACCVIVTSPHGHREPGERGRDE